MKHNPSKYLADMLDRCQYLIGLTSGKSIENYKRDRLFRSAIERELQNIGEALRQLQSRSPDTAKSASTRELFVFAMRSCMDMTSSGRITFGT